jgi:hypothetical protein
MAYVKPVYQQQAGQKVWMLIWNGVLAAKRASSWTHHLLEPDNIFELSSFGYREM